MKLFNGFKASFEKPEEQITTRIGGTLRNKLHKHSQGVMRIIEAILFLIQRGLPLRGHRDSGEIVPSSVDDTNDGLFRDIIKLMINSGDTVLERHIQESQKNATYLSPQIQNEIIGLVGKDIERQIVEEIGDKPYVVSIDETQDIAKCEQLSIIVRFFGKVKMEERLVSMIDCYDEMEKGQTSLNGENIAKIVINRLKKVGLNLQNIAFVCTDGASVMTSMKKGFIAFFKQQVPHVSLIVCNAHCVNNSVGKGMSLPGIQKGLNLANEIVTFFSHAKRATLLKKINCKKLKSFCQTRWSEQESCVSSVVENLKDIVIMLENVSNGDDPSLKTSVDQLLTTIRNPDAILPLLVAQNILNTMHPLVMQLQQVDICADEVLGAIKRTVESLTETRNSMQEWNDIYMNHLKLSAEIGSTLSRESLRDSVAHSKQLLTDVFLKPIDAIVSDLNLRLQHNERVSMILFKLMPKYISDLVQEDVREIAKNYCSLLNMTEEQLFQKVNGELKTYKKQFKGEFSVRQMIESTSNFKAINSLLKIAELIPASNATAERSFSALRRVKSYLRNTMLQDRLNGIMLAHSNFDIQIDPKRIFNAFVDLACRRIDFVKFDI